MARIKGSNTKPELIVRRIVHSLGFRFRLHRRDLPGTPDIIFSRLKFALFVHGCFWHRHAGCRLTTSPRANAEFWNEKFSRNVKRDKKAARQLRSGGWHVAVVWECETKNPERLKRRLAKLLKTLDDSGV